MKIKVGDHQPFPCKQCGFSGYQFSDRIAIYYVQLFNSDGSSGGGFYSDNEKSMNQSNKAVCCNCLETLPFKLER